MYHALAPGSRQGSAQASSALRSTAVEGCTVGDAAVTHAVLPNDSMSGWISATASAQWRRAPSRRGRAKEVGRCFRRAELSLDDLPDRLPRLLLPRQQFIGFHVNGDHLDGHGWIAHLSNVPCQAGVGVPSASSASLYAVHHSAIEVGIGQEPRPHRRRARCSRACSRRARRSLDKCVWERRASSKPSCVAFNIDGRRDVVQCATLTECRHRRSSLLSRCRSLSVVPTS